MEVYQGKSVFGGIAIGRISVHKKDEQQVKRVKIENPDLEIARYRQARQTAMEQLQNLYQKALKEVGEANAAIFEIHQMMLEDDDYNESIENIIHMQQVNAEYAVASTGDNFAQMFASMEDDYMRARSADVKDISERVLSVLGGRTAGMAASEEPVIIVADDLAPSETVQLNKDLVLSFVTVHGSVNSHTAILARTMSIPALIGTDIPLTDAIDGKLGIVDGRNGCIYVDPDEDTLSKMQQLKQEEQEKKELLQTLKGRENITIDGKKIMLYANIGNSKDLAAVLQNDAGGIGLFRSEFLYLERETFPTEEEQFQIYRTVAETMAGKPVIIRTLDIGADKKCDYFEMEPEENPAMGCRAIRICLTRPEIFKTQLRALFRASAFGNISIMYPMIISVEEVHQIKEIVAEVKQELTEYELIPVDWGGTTEFVPVSAKSGEGIDTLLETIILTAEILELKANPNRQARGLVIEAELDKGRGSVATVLVQKGTLHVGDFVSAGAAHGKVRAMVDDKGRRVKEAGPSTPVEILGLSDVPNAGEILIAHENDKTAKQFAETFVAQNKVKKLEETKSKMSLDDLFTKIQEGNLKELNLIIKADVQGSVEAVKQSLLKLSNEEVVVKCIHGGVGAINESDVTLASASNAIIIGFNVRPDANAKSMAEQNGVDIRLYRVIYQAIEDVEAAMKGMLEPVYEEKVIGHAEVRQLFKASGVGTIAGSYVLDGTFQRGCKVRISREGNQIFEGNLASLKRFKDDVKEVRSGYECGLVFEGFNDLQEFDQVEAYIMVEVPR